VQIPNKWHVGVSCAISLGSVKPVDAGHLHGDGAFRKRRSIARVRLSGVESADWPILQAGQLSKQSLLRSSREEYGSAVVTTTC
jgi:hypothetical protein